MASPPPPRSFLRSFWATVSFLLAFCVLMVFVANYYLVPALSAVHGADASGRRQLSAVSALVLSVLLTVLLVVLMLAFRPHRFFFPRGGRTVIKTKYVDAWAEAGKRASGDSN